MLNFFATLFGAPRTLGAPGLCPPLSIGCDATAGGQSSIEGHGGLTEIAELDIDERSMCNARTWL